MEGPSQRLLRLGFGFAVSQAIRVVAELKIPDLMSGGERTIDDLAAATGSHAGALYRVMRLLAAEGVFSEVSPRRFALTDVGGALRSDTPAGPRNFLRMINSEVYLAFGRLRDSVRTGEPVFEAAFGKPRFDWLADHPELVRRVIVPAELKWEVRDKLDQANINERTLFPGLDGLSRWLERYYLPKK